MVDSTPLRNRRSYLHRKGDHSLCRPQRCEVARAAASAGWPGSHQGPLRVVQEPAVGPRPGRLTSATLDELQAVGREGSTDGVAAVVLAELFDRDGHTGTAAASLVKAHREALNRALEGAGESADVVDGIFGTA